MKAKILIVEPSEIIVTGLTNIIGGTDRFVVLDALADYSRLQERVLSSHPDAVLINPTLGGTANCAKLVVEIHEAGAQAVALAYQYVEAAVLKAFDAVVDVCDSRAVVIEKLTEVLSNDTDEARQGGDSCALSDRETAVLVEVARGLSSKEIADRLNISVHTVVSHRKNITKKTGIKSVAGLAVYAVLNNLVDSSYLTDL